MWHDYVRERLGHEVYQTDHGFVTYSIKGEACEIIDIYVQPDKRREGIGWQMANEVTRKALEAGCKRLIGFVWFGTAGAEDSMQAQLAYGFKLNHSDGQRIILVKEIGG